MPFLWAGGNTIPSQHYMLGHHWYHMTEKRWQADVGPLMVVLGSSLPSSTKKKTNKKNIVKVYVFYYKQLLMRAKCANSSQPSLRSDL